MKRLTLKYNWLYLVVLSATFLVACEPTQVSIDRNAVAFKNGQMRAIDDAGNARIFAYCTTDNTNLDWLYGGDVEEDGTLPGAKAKIYNIEQTETPRVSVGKIEIDGETKYWSNATYNFFAIYSKNLDANKTTIIPQFKFNIENNTNKKIFSFPYDLTNNQHNELFIASNLNEQHTAEEKEEVKFEFNHILSKINFNIRKSYANEGDVIKVTSISLSGLYNSGNFNLEVESETIGWTTTGKDDFSHILDGDGVAIDVKGTRVLDSYRIGGGLLVIPQTIALNQMEIVIEYTYYDGESSTVEKYRTKAKLPASEWKLGDNYTYNLILSPITNDIFFSTPTIENWNEAQVGGTIIIQ